MKLKFNTTVLKLSLAAIILSVILIGCAENDQKDFEIHEGYFEDSAVQGLKYKTITNEGMTDKSGKFYYCTGELITFYVGDIKLGESAEAKSYMTPKDLVPQDKGNPEQNKLLIARFLQTLDSNNNPKDGITIDEKIHEKAVKTDSFDPEKIIFIADEKTGVTPTSSTVTFSACEQSLYSSINLFKASAIMPITTTVVNENDAKAHLIAAETKQDQIEKGLDPTSKINPKISVYRDDMGVWFINGPDDVSLYDVFYEVGYQVATDRLWQLESYQRAARGRLADLLGDKESIETDEKVLTMGYSESELKVGFDNLDDNSQKVISGYVDGINKRIEYVKQNRSELPLEFVAIGYQLKTDLTPTTWTVEDVLAWSTLLQRNFDPEALQKGQIENAQLFMALTSSYTATQGQLMFKDLRWLDDEDAQTYITRSEAEKFKLEKINNGKRQNSFNLPDIQADFSQTLKIFQKFESSTKTTYDKLGINIKMGSYAWVVHGSKTTSGNPILYAGPQMGFESPSICIECSIEAGGIKVSGMMIPGIPGVILGRTPHHAWSMQVGHVHSTDYYFDVDSSKATFDRSETISIGNGAAVKTINVYKIEGRPVVSPENFDPNTYEFSQAESNYIVSWRYSHVNHEFDMVKAMLTFAKAKSYTDFGAGIEDLGLSQHFCYADTDGNIAYWMSGRDPVRPEPDPTLKSSIYLLPQMPPNQLPWNDDILKPRSQYVNPARGYFAGWNNRSHHYYDNSPNNIYYSPGPFHRSHVIYDYLDKKTTNGNKISYDEVKNLAKHIAKTDSFAKGGIPWKFVASACSKAITSVTVEGDYSTENRLTALEIIKDWYSDQNGYFIAGVEKEYTSRYKGWKLMDKWMRKIVDKTFAPYTKTVSHLSIDSSDANGAEGKEDAANYFGMQQYRRLFNVIIRSFQSKCYFNWFTGTVQPLQSHEASSYTTIVLALDEAITELGGIDFLNAPKNNLKDRGFIPINNKVVTNIKLLTMSEISKKTDIDIDTKTYLLTLLTNSNLWEFPFASRSTYTQCLEYGSDGPIQIESFFPLGQSGQINWSLMLVGASDPQFKQFTAPHYTSFYHKHFFDMSLKYFDNFVHREFPLFK